MVRRAPPGSPVVVAVGPMLDAVLEGTAGMRVAVAYTARPFPLDAETLERFVAQDLVLVEPYLEGTSASAITQALRDQPIRLCSIGVGHGELRRYGTSDDHIRAWGLDPAGLRTTIDNFLGVAV